MLIIFKSKASGDVMMFGDVAQRLLDAMGKARTRQGIVTVEQLADAIARLKQAVAEDKAQPARGGDADQDRERERPSFVSLAQRALPLLELLERAHKQKVPVTWETQ